MPGSASSRSHARFTGATSLRPRLRILLPASTRASSGRPSIQTTLVRIDLPVARIGPDEIAAHVLIVDRFGNVQLNLTTGDVEGFGIWPGSELELAIGLERFYAVAAETFADVGPGRHRPLRGLLPEHRDCHQRGRRGVRRARAPG